MKRLFICIFTLLLVMSCSGNNDKTEINTVSLDNGGSQKTNEVVTPNNTVKPNPDEKGLYDYKMPQDYNIQSNDLLIFDKMLSNDLDFFKDSEEDIFFNIWRYQLFGENPSSNLDKLNDCLAGILQPEALSGFDQKICIGENKYLLPDNTNFFHIKDTLIQYKKIKNGEDVSCNYFLESNYDVPTENLATSTYVDYLVCNKLKNDTGYDLSKQDFYFHTAKEIGECDILEDKNLIKLCNEKT